MGGSNYFKVTSNTGRNMLKIGALAAVGGVAFAIFFYFGPIFPSSTWAPKQPIAFSHKLHAGDNEINCQYCHTYARRSEMSGIPSVKTCMNCHSRMLKKVNTEKVQEVISYFKKGEPIPWVRVYDLPDHVWYSHKRHIQKDIACQTCHGPVETMEVLSRERWFKMGFCLDCHNKDNQAPTDCWTCHT